MTQEEGKVAPHPLLALWQEDVEHLGQGWDRPTGRWTAPVDRHGLDMVVVRDFLSCPRGPARPAAP